MSHTFKKGRQPHDLEQEEQVRDPETRVASGQQSALEESQRELRARREELTGRMHDLHRAHEELSGGTHDTSIDTVVVDDPRGNLPPNSLRPDKQEFRQTHTFVNNTPIDTDWVGVHGTVKDSGWSYEAQRYRDVKPGESRPFYINGYVEEQHAHVGFWATVNPLEAQGIFPSPGMTWHLNRMSGLVPEDLLSEIGWFFEAEEGGVKLNLSGAEDLTDGESVYVDLRTISVEIEKPPIVEALHQLCEWINAGETVEVRSERARIYNDVIIHTAVGRKYALQAARWVSSNAPDASLFQFEFGVSIADGRVDMPGVVVTGTPDPSTFYAGVTPTDSDPTWQVGDTILELNGTPVFNEYQLAYNLGLHVVDRGNLVPCDVLVQRAFGEQESLQVHYRYNKEYFGHYLPGNEAELLASHASDTDYSAATFMHRHLNTPGTFWGRTDEERDRLEQEAVLLVRQFERDPVAVARATTPEPVHETRRAARDQRQPVRASVDVRRRTPRVDHSTHTLYFNVPFAVDVLSMWQDDFAATHEQRDSEGWIQTERQGRDSHEVRNASDGEVYFAYWLRASHKQHWRNMVWMLNDLSGVIPKDQLHDYAWFHEAEPHARSLEVWLPEEDRYLTDERDESLFLTPRTIRPDDGNTYEEFTHPLCRWINAGASVEERAERAKVYTSTLEQTFKGWGIALELGRRVEQDGTPIKAWLLGIQVEAENPDWQGVKVLDVLHQDSLWGDQLPWEPGDTILEFNGTPVFNQWQLFYLLDHHVNKDGIEEPCVAHVLKADGRRQDYYVSYRYNPDFFQHVITEGQARRMIALEDSLWRPVLRLITVQKDGAGNPMTNAQESHWAKENRMLIYQMYPDAAEQGAWASWVIPSPLNLVRLAARAGKVARLGDKGQRLTRLAVDVGVTAAEATYGSYQEPVPFGDAGLKVDAAGRAITSELVFDRVVDVLTRRR